MRRYQNEIVLSIAFILMVASYIYKDNRATRIDTIKSEVAISIGKVGEIIALKNQWGNSKLSSNIRGIKQIVPSSSIKKFEIKSKKLTATFVGLSSKDMNRVITKLENIAVQIVKLKITNIDEKYHMEIKCKW